MSNFRSKPSVPTTVADLELAVVIEALSRFGCNITDAAADLGVPASDLRRLLWANPRLQDEAFEVVEARIDTAEKNIAEALRSEDPRMRVAASFFVVRNSLRAKRRGWITSASAGVELNISPPREVVYHWRSSLGEKTKEQLDAEDGKVARLQEEGKQVISIGWGMPDDDSQTIEHENGTETIERDGKAIPVPRYGDRCGDDCLEGEVATPSVLIEHAAAVAPEPEPAASSRVKVVPESESVVVRYERERIDAWIRNRLIDWSLASCMRCRLPFVAGSEWQEVSNAESRARFHRTCHAEWRTEQEAAARQALGLKG